MVVMTTLGSSLEGQMTPHYDLLSVFTTAERTFDEQCLKEGQLNAEQMKSK